MFRDRADAARQLATELRQLRLHHPLILAIPRGGVVTGAVLATELGGGLDVVLSRTLRAPFQPELALGAIAESGDVYLSPYAFETDGVSEEYLRQEQEHQLAEIARRKKLFRQVRPAASVTGRCVIVTDDGIATGSTMMAALKIVRAQQPSALIVAVPVAPRGQVQAFEALCDRLVCLESPVEFWSVGAFYENFPTVEDEQVIELLTSCTAKTKAAAARQ